MAKTTKPAIPGVPKAGDPRDRFDQAVKEILEILTARRVDKIPPLENAGERWRDLLSDISVDRDTGTNKPTWAIFRNGIRAWSFSATGADEVWASFHITHDYKMGTKAYPHIHWAVTGVDTGVVRWGFEYTVAKGHGQQAFPASTTVYVEQAATGVAYAHMVAEVSDADAVPGLNLEPDSLVLIRIFRDGAHANDTQTSAAFGFFADLHYQSDGNDTVEKRPGWTKNTSEHGQDTLDKVNAILDRLQ